MRLGLRIIPKGVWVGLRQLSCLLRASLWDLLLHRWNQRKTNIRQPERGHYSHKMATRSLRGNRECGQGYSTLVWFCRGEVLWPFCVGADESQIFFFFKHHLAAGTSSFTFLSFLSQGPYIEQWNKAKGWNKLKESETLRAGRLFKGPP